MTTRSFHVSSTWLVAIGDEDRGASPGGGAGVVRDIDEDCTGEGVCVAVHARD
jgi:hypothetical protein